jgi:RimJ/RimL family protein N-acetyltransferase
MIRLLPERPILATSRLILRSPVAEDAPRIAELASDPGVARMTTSIPYPLAREQAEGFLERMEARDPAREEIFAIDLPGEGLIGLIGFHPGERPAPEMGYWLGRTYWGRGYATEAARSALAWVRDHWKKRYVVAGYFADNPASGEVLVKAGFLYTGEIEFRYSMARDAEAATRMMVWLA